MRTQNRHTINCVAVNVYVVLGEPFLQKGPTTSWYFRHQPHVPQGRTSQEMDHKKQQKYRFHSQSAVNESTFVPAAWILGKVQKESDSRCQSIFFFFLNACYLTYNHSPRARLWLPALGERESKGRCRLMTQSKQGVKGGLFQITSDSCRHRPEADGP